MTSTKYGYVISVTVFHSSKILLCLWYLAFAVVCMLQ